MLNEEGILKYLKRLEKKIDALLKMTGGEDNPAKKYIKSVSILDIVSELQKLPSIKHAIMYVLQRKEGDPVNLLDFAEAFEKCGGFIKGNGTRKGDTCVAAICKEIKIGRIVKVKPRIYKWNTEFDKVEIREYL
jgi:hypothetical protein